jgi:hypothetical protein
MYTGSSADFAPANDLAHLPGGFTVEFSAQDHLRKRLNLDFGAAQPGQVQPLLGGTSYAV